MSASLSITNLSKSFVGEDASRINALRDVSLHVNPGEVVGLVGPDGAGKTTLLRICAGLLVPDSGSASVLGLDSVRDTIKVRTRIGYMPQKFGLYQDLSVRENLDLYADLQSVPESQREHRYKRLLEMTGLGSFIDRFAGRLSGGMKQKLGLACALIKSPELLLLDEPTVGVDPVSRRDLWKIVYELVEQDGIGVLLSTAYLDEAERCTRVAVMFNGGIVDQGETSKFNKRIRDRVFEKPCEDGREARRIQTLAHDQDSVADATIVSGRVRIVVRKNKKLTSPELIDAERVEPRFEDAFMAIADEQRREHVKLRSGDRSSGGASNNEQQRVIRARDLVKRFGDFTAVDHVSFDVRRGEVFGLLGPNGAGKTTTFRMLCGLLSVSSGEIEIAGHDIRRSGAPARAALGYMAQKFSMYGTLSVAENLRFYGRIYGLYGKRLRERIAWAYEEFDLSDRRREQAGALPGGYKQRLAMAVALLHDPKVLFLDEPTSGVDPLARREFWRRINRVAQQGVTVIVTTHFMEEAEFCDRMLIQSRGKPLALGTPGQIRDLARRDARPDPTIEDAFIALSLDEVDVSGSDVDPAQAVGEPIGGTP